MAKICKKNELEMIGVLSKAIATIVSSGKA